jgi:pimeloyl-ACP methyl ester carboxylesterase
MEILNSVESGTAAIGEAPAIVFLPGAGAIGHDYWNLQRAAAEFGTGVLYDRAGTGGGAPAELPRSSTEVTDELRTLLRENGVAAPYLLVGHSLGGLYAQHYAARFPDEVSALLLLDPADGGYRAAMPRELQEIYESFDADKSAETFENLPEEGVRFYRGLFEQELADWPAEVREPLIDYHISSRGLKIGFQEASNVEDLYAEVRAAGPLPDVPLLVLSSNLVDPFKAVVAQGIAAHLLEGEIAGKHRLYRDLAGTVPRGEFRTVEGGHVTIHLRGEREVTAAMRELAAAARVPGRDRLG